MNFARRSHTATVLADGKVFVSGGLSGSGTINSVEFYDPSIGTWTIVGSLNTQRVYHSVSLLTDGQVLHVGGYNGAAVLNSAELYSLS